MKNLKKASIASDTAACPQIYVVCLAAHYHKPLHSWITAKKAIQQQIDERLADSLIPKSENYTIGDNRGFYFPTLDEKERVEDLKAHGALTAELIRLNYAISFFDKPHRQEDPKHVRSDLDYEKFNIFSQGVNHHLAVAVNGGSHIFVPPNLIAWLNTVLFFFKTQARANNRTLNTAASLELAIQHNV